MVTIYVKCPFCGSENINKFGKNKKGKQKYQCCNKECKTKTFILDYDNKGCLPGVKHKIIQMAMNGSGVRDTARVLGISINTVISELKKKESEIHKINITYLNNIESPNEIEVDIVKIDEAEVDEMWSYVGSKENQRWLWHAIDHKTGMILAFTFGRRKDKVFEELKKMLEPFGIKTYYTDNLGTYERKLDKTEHEVGKRNTQKIERKHLTLRTRIKRLARKTICFSKLEKMHDTIIGLFINITEFGLFTYI